MIENLQREDLNPLEEALGYRKLIDEYELTQDEVSRIVGKSRTNVTNMLRILNLSEEVKRLVELGELSAGHARALLGITDAAQQAEAAMMVLEKELSVRQTENLVRGWADKKRKKKNPKRIWQRWSYKKNSAKNWARRCAFRKENKREKLR